MARILIVLVSVGVLINALTFLMVAHYFSGKKESQAAVGPAKPGATPEAPAPINPELSKRLAGLEATLSKLQGDIRQLSTRSSAVSPPAATARSTRKGSITRPTRPGGTSTTGDDAPEEEPPAAASEPAEPTAKKMAPPHPVGGEGEKTAPPADPSAGGPPHEAVPGAVPGAEGTPPPGGPPPGGDPGANPPGNPPGPAPEGTGTEGNPPPQGEVPSGDQ
jgi:hypothetical protein